MSADLREHYDLVRRQRDALMRLGLQKERLTAFVVHDLKNPVSAMDLHAQVLLHDRELPQRARDTAKHIRSDARALTRLILNLLDISKSEEGKLSARPSQVDLTALVRDALESLEVKASAAEVSLEQNLEATAIYADPDLTRRVLENLLDNAIRHAPKGARVLLSSAARAQAVEVRVEDTGSGISPALREKIFEPYVQLEADPGATTRSGRGLGLTFCRLAVEAHGGKIWVEDANPGARFCFELPGAG
jgi:signal transduction histidine kinase